MIFLEADLLGKLGQEMS